MFRWGGRWVEGMGRGVLGVMNTEFLRHVFGEL